MEKEYVIARTYSAGVFAGIMQEQSEDGKRVVLTDARRIWYWEGASSLSQLATTGTTRPENCKFPIAVPKVQLTEVIELLSVTTEAEKSIREVPVWEQK